MGATATLEKSTEIEQMSFVELEKQARKVELFSRHMNENCNHEKVIYAFTILRDEMFEKMFRTPRSNLHYRLYADADNAQKELHKWQSDKIFRFRRQLHSSDENSFENYYRRDVRLFKQMNKDVLRFTPELYLFQGVSENRIEIINEYVARLLRSDSAILKQLFIYFSERSNQGNEHLNVPNFNIKPAVYDSVSFEAFGYLPKKKVMYSSNLSNTINKKLVDGY